MNNNFDRTSSGFSVCDSCGELLSATATFCPNCGSRKITRGTHEERQVPLEGGMEYHNADYYTPVVSAHRYDAYTETNDARGYYGGNPAEEYEEEYEEEYREDEYRSAPAPTASSVRVFAVTCFLAAVLAVAFFGLMISLIPHSDSPDTAAQDDNHSVSDVTPAVSSEKPVVHKLPNDLLDDSCEIFTTDDNKFGWVAASSSIDEKVTKGSIERAFDGDPDTCWQDGVDGYGEGEFIYAFNKDKSAVTVSSITVYNGYQSTKYNTKTKDMYKNNSRVSDFTLEFDDGTTLSFTLEDEKEPQTFNFKKRETCYVKFIIDGVYKGKKHKDTCIGEIIYK